MKDQKQITTLSVFRFRTGKYWAFKQMRLSLDPLSAVEGLTFFKVLGCGGGNGFSIFPDFGTYAILQVWRSEDQADNYFKSHSLHAAYRERSESYQIIYMNASEGHGQWDGDNPFDYYPGDHHDKPVLVLTRATIHPGKLLNFWRYVPSVSRSMEGAPGLRFALGIGELPLIQQATVSLWDSVEDMKNYAYSMKKHKKVVSQTRKQQWYKEELFTRFVPYRSEGNIEALAIG